MLGGLTALFGTVAVGAWLVAVFSAVQVARLAPAGQRWNSWFALGWWRFDKIRQIAGPKVDIWLRRYAAGFLTFFLAIFASMVIGLFLAIEQKEAAGDLVEATEPERITDPRIISVRTALRAVRPSPSSALES